MAKLPSEFHYSFSAWAAKKIELDEEVDCLDYSSSSQTYVLGASRLEDFKLPDDDEVHPEWKDEGMLL